MTRVDDGALQNHGRIAERALGGEHLPVVLPLGNRRLDERQVRGPHPVRAKAEDDDPHPRIDLSQPRPGLGQQFIGVIDPRNKQQPHLMEFPEIGEQRDCGEGRVVGAAGDPAMNLRVEAFEVDHRPVKERCEAAPGGRGRIPIGIDEQGQVRGRRVRSRGTKEGRNEPGLHRRFATTDRHPGEEGCRDPNPVEDGGDVNIAHLGRRVMGAGG